MNLLSPVEKTVHDDTDAFVEKGVNDPAYNFLFITVI